MNTINDGFCYVDEEEECKFKCGDKIYTRYCIDARFKIKEKLDKRTIHVYALCMFTDKGSKMLEEMKDTNTKATWAKMEQTKEYFDIHGTKLNKLTKPLQNFVLTKLTRNLEKLNIERGSLVG